MRAFGGCQLGLKRWKGKDLRVRDGTMFWRPRTDDRFCPREEDSPEDDRTLLVSLSLSTSCLKH